MAAMVSRYFVKCFENGVLSHVVSVFERTQAFRIVKLAVDHRILKESKGIRLIKDLL